MIIRHLIDSFNTVRPGDFMDKTKTSDGRYPKKQLGCPSHYVHSFFNDRFSLGEVHDYTSKGHQRNIPCSNKFYVGF